MLVHTGQAEPGEKSTTDLLAASVCAGSPALELVLLGITQNLTTQDRHSSQTDLMRNNTSTIKKN